MVQTYSQKTHSINSIWPCSEGLYRSSLFTFLNMPSNTIHFTTHVRTYSQLLWTLQAYSLWLWSKRFINYVHDTWNSDPHKSSWYCNITCILNSKKAPSDFPIHFLCSAFTWSNQSTSSKPSSNCYMNTHQNNDILITTYVYSVIMWKQKHSLFGLHMNFGLGSQ